MTFDNGCSWSHSKVTFEKMIVYLTQFNGPVKRFYLKHAATLAAVETAEFFIMKTLDADSGSNVDISKII